jgi:hypothetical protein
VKIRFVLSPFLFAFLPFLFAFAVGPNMAHAQHDTRNATTASSGGAGGVRGEGRPWRVVETIFRQPDVGIQAVDNCLIGEVHPSGERFLVRLANLGENATATAISWDVGRYTGFRPGQGEPVARFQRGPRQSAEGTAVQIQRREIGIWIDSDHPRPRRGALIPVCPAYWWWDRSRAPRPFHEADRELSFSFDLGLALRDIRVLLLAR